MNSFPKIIISGGGTGGHIFPAIAIANALKKIVPLVDILFVGAEGRMEMEKVPAAGFRIVGLKIAGIQRGSILKNLSLPFKVIRSVWKAKQIIKEFKPNAVIGVGGYASGPLLYAASLQEIPYLIQEQNSFAGITNKLLGKKAQKICVAFDGMEQFFPKDRILKTGNPVRNEMVFIEGKRELALQTFNLSSAKKTILITGGSLGAGTINKSIEKHLNELIAQDIQLIWQTGKYYYQGIINRLGENFHPNVKIMEFVQRMDLAYAAADLIISRAGAGTIAELCIVRKPVILVPSPNVAEDHQTKNAQALAKENAAVLIADRSAEDLLVNEAVQMLKSEQKMNQLSNNIAKLALVDADEVIAKEVLKLVNK